MSSVPTCLVLLDGDLEGLVSLACAAEAGVVAGDASGSVVAACVDADPIRHDAALRQASAHDTAWLDVTVSAKRGTSGKLIAVGEASAAAGIPKIVWPVRVSPGRWRVREAATAMDRALLVERLISLDASELGLAEMRIETPMVDLDDEQLAELAADMAVSLDLCWWWGDASQAATDAREHWRGALGRFGLSVA